MLLSCALASCQKTAVGNASFTYPGDSKSDYESTLFYSDSYFQAPSTTYNPSLATASLSFAMASFASINEAAIKTNTRYRNIEALFQKTGFENFLANGDYHQKSTTDSIGLVFGTKMIESTPLIYIGTRGANYEEEWASNMSIAGPEDGKLPDSGFHYGFRKAANQLIEELKNYIAAYDIKGEIKIWTSGFSRGGATANIASGLLDDAIAEGTKPLGDEIILKKENVYSYCFEPPMGAPTTAGEDGLLLARGERYSNIFNHVNFNDPVPLVAMKEVGYTRFGIDRYFPDSISYLDCSNQHNQMLELLRELPNYDSRFKNGYSIDKFRMKHLHGLKLEDDPNAKSWTQGLFVRELVSELTKKGLGASSKETMLSAKERYAEDIQPALRQIFTTLYHSGNFRGSLVDLAVSVASDIVSMFDIDLIIADIMEKEQRQYLIADLTLILNRGFRKFGIAFGLEDIKAKVETFVNILATFAAETLASMNSPLILSLISTTVAPAIGSGHFPELCLAQSRSLDPHYVRNPFLNTNPSGKHYFVRATGHYADMKVTHDRRVIAETKESNVLQDKTPTRVNWNAVETVLPYGGSYTIDIPSQTPVEVLEFDYRYEGEYRPVEITRDSNGSFTL